MNGTTKDKLYQVCKESVTGKDGNADDLYNILEGYIFQYLDEVEEQ